MAGLGAPPHYHAYLLRLWEERGQRGDGPGGWRCSLEDPHTGERRGFASLGALVAFLQAELDRDGDRPQDGSAEASEPGGQRR